jgi:hypothetical protein
LYVHTLERAVKRKMHFSILVLIVGLMVVL